MIDMHVCQELWCEEGSPCPGYFPAMINGSLSLSSPKEDAETKVKVQIVYLGTTNDAMQKMRQRGRKVKCGLPLDTG